MKLRVALAVVAVFGLSACGTTSSTDLSTSEPSASTPTTTTAELETKAPLVVRGPIVPDDPEPVVAPTKRVKTASVAPGADLAAEEPASEASKPVVPAKPTKPEKTAPPVKTADAAELPKPADTAPATDSAPAPSDTAPSSTPAVVESAPTSPAPAKPSLFSNPSAFMQATIGGFPIWLAGLIGLVLLVALAVAFGGRRKQTEVI